MRFLLTSLFTFFIFISFSQVTDELEKEVIYKYERSFYFQINSNGWGAGARLNKFINGFNMRVLDFSFSNVRANKQIRINPYYGRSYFYGKVNSFFMLRALYGRHKLITTKPYWGGVQLRYFFQGGIGIGIEKPIYIYVYTTGDNYILEKYDPDVHFYSNIYGAGPFLTGFDEIQLKPSISLKTSIDFEFGTDTQSSNSLEAGIIADVFPFPYQIMANKEKNYYLLSLYFAFHFGDRFN